MSVRPVLIVEDDKDVRENLAYILQTEGFPVSTAEHGAAALQHLQKSEQLPGCILLDLMMPIMDGMTFLNEIQHERFSEVRNIPVVIVSAFGPSTWPASWAAFPEEIERIKKPIDLPDLIRRIERHCGRPSIQSPTDASP